MTGYLAVTVGCSLLAAVCVATQYFVKRILQPRQYTYFRDLLLAGTWLLAAVWFGSPHARVVVAAAFLMGVAGLCGDLYTPRGYNALCLLTGALCAAVGPAIRFIRFADGQYIYFTPTSSFVLTTFWFAVFPMIFRHMDEIPGLVGHTLAVTFSLTMTAVLLIGGQPQSEAFFMAFAGLSLLMAFWSRFGSAYRQAGSAMSAMWSVLVAGAAVLGSSKGIVFSSMFFLSAGLFAVPAAELSLCWFSRMFADSPNGAECLYRRMIARGLEHHEAVRFVAGICALISISAAVLQAPKSMTAMSCWGAAALLAAAITLPLLAKHRHRRSVHGDMTLGKQSRGPELWGVTIDNLSMNYAVSRARGLIYNPPDDRAQLVVTVNALSMNDARKSEEYRSLLNRAAMVLADGAGMIWGMRFLGMPVQERVAGIDFAEQICRAASSEGWPVYFLGAEGCTARECAAVMAERYPGLKIAGARDGYFDMYDVSVADKVADSGAKVLLAAMGQPRQEKWVDMYADRLGPMLAVGVGGAFDVFAGHLKRAPKWVQRIGMEWLYRLIQEPFRWKKDLGLMTFVLRIFASKLRSMR